MTLSISPETHPVIAILAIHLPKQANSQIIFLKTLLRQTTFHHFSKDELTSLFKLLSDKKPLSSLKNDFNFKSEVSLNSVESILTINPFPDQMSIDISAFFILRAVITFLCQPPESFQSSSFLKLLSLMNYVNTSTYSNTLKNAFVYLITENAKNIKESFLEDFNKQIMNFTQKYPDYPQGLVDAMVYTIKSLTSQNQVLSAIDLSFLNFSAKIINNFVGKRNFDNLKEPLLSSLSPFLKKFDPIAFKFLSQIISIFPFSDIRPIIEQIPNTIIDHVEKDKTYFPVTIKDIDSLPEPLVVEMTSNQRFPFQTMDTFKDGFAMKYPTLPLEKKKITFFFPPDIFDLLRSLYVISRSNDVQQFFSTNFIKIINENAQSEKLFDIMIISLMICRDMELSKVILQSKLFSPRITMFNFMNNVYGNDFNAELEKAKAYADNDKQGYEFASDYEAFFVARTIIFRLLIDISPIFEEIINPISKMPTILADFFHYFSLDVQSVMKLSNDNESFIKCLCNLSSLYQTANIEMSEHLKEIEFARGQMIRFTLNLLSQKENVGYLSSAIMFCQMLFSYMYEAPLRSTVLSTLEIASAKATIDYTVCISDFFYNLFENVKDKKFKQEVIRSISKIIIANNEYQKCFPNCINPLMSDLKDLQKDEFSKEYLLDIIQFVSNASENAQAINSQDILDAIKRVEGDEPSEAIYNALLSLIAGETLSEITPTFQIKHPNILTLFLMAFNKSNKYVSILKFLKELVINSRENAVACQKGNLDLLLLDIIQDCKCNTDNEIIAPAVGLFVHIASVASSPETIRKFFKIFAPIAPNTVSPNQSFFFATLSDLVSTEEFKPFSYFKMDQNSPVVKVNGVYGKYLSSGFTIVLWLFSDPSPSSAPRIFSITDDKQRGYELYINSNTLKLKISYGGNATTNEINEKDLPLGPVVKGKWINVSLSLMKTDNGFNIVSAIDQAFATPLEIENVNLDKGQLKVVFGGSTEENSKAQLDTAALGPFGIFSLLKSSQIIDIARNNMRTRPDLGRACCIYVEPVNSNKELSLEYNGIKGTSATLEGPIVEMPLTFPQILVEYCSLTTLLPLMNQVEAIMEGKQQPTTSLSMIIMNLMSILKYQPQSQIVFDEVNGIRSLTYLLSKSNEKHLDYMLYQNFIQLFETVTYEPLKNDIFEKILINPEIWVLSNGLSQLQISRHWSRQLYPNYWELIKKYVSFQRLLKLLRIYYHYTPAEKNIAWLRRFDEIPVNDVRQNLLQILHTFATKHFSPADFSGLIAQIISCTDPDQIIDLLSFLKLLVVSPESPIQNVKDSWYLLSSLHQLIQSKNESILFNIIDVFMALHFLGLIQKPKVTRHVYVLMDLIPKASLTNSFFLKILPLAKKYPTFMPIIFYIAMNLGETNLHFLKENLQPSPEIAVPKHWTLMPLLASLKFGNLHDFQEFVMKYMASCSDEKWDESFAQIDLIQRIFKVDVEEEKSLFLGDVCERIISNNELFKFDLLHTFLDVAIFHIFFKPIDEMNAALVHEFKNSPFSDEVADLSDEPLPKCLPEITKDLFFEKLADYNLDVLRKYRFGLRFNREGQWLDRDLGKTIFKLAMKTKSQTFHNVSALILLFLYHETPDEVRSDIEMLIKRNVIDPPYADLLKRTVIDPKKKVGESCFEVFIRDSTPQNDGMSQFINQLAGRLQRHHVKCNNEKEEIAEKADYGLKATNSQEMHQEICVESHQRELYAKDWHVLWRMMTFDRFPWHNEKGNDLDILTRDNTLSDFYCPTQWKYKRTKYANFLSSTKKPKMLSKMKRADTQPVISKPLESTLSFIDSGNTEINDIPIHVIKFGNVSRLCNLTVKGSTITLNYPTHSKEISSSMIDEISVRLILHHQNGIEIITKGKRKGILINLLSQNSVSILKQIASKIEFKNVQIQTQPMLPYFKEQNITEKWVKGELSNFRYLMLLNKFSGRSFLSESMYPIMPWIVNDYESTEINPTNKSIFRDFAKPMMAGQPFSSPNSVINFLRKCDPFLSLSQNLEFMPIRSKNQPEAKQEPVVQPPPQPAQEEQQPVEEQKPAEEQQPVEEQKPAEEPQPVEEQKPAEQQQSAETTPEQPAETTQEQPAAAPEQTEGQQNETPEQPTETAEKPAESTEQTTAEKTEEPAAPEKPAEQPQPVSPPASQPPAHSVNIQAPLAGISKLNAPSSLPSKAKRYQEFTSIPQAFADNQGRELTPEFFFSPEFFEGIELPKWASSPIEFVYKNRKMLESNHVSSHIHQWIDLFWGIDQKNLGLDQNYYEAVWNDPTNVKSIIKKQEIELIKRNNGQVPPQLFKERHPTRNFTDFSPSVVCAHCFDGDGTHRHLYAKLDIKHVNEKTFVFSCVNTDFSVYNLKLDAEKQMMLTKDTSASFHCNNFALYGTHIVGVDGKGKLKIARDNGEAIEIKGTSHINPSDVNTECVIASDQPITVIGYQDSSIALFHNNEFIKLIPTFSSSITCIDVNACFGLIVAGNADGSILFLSSNDGTPKSCVNTNGVIPKMVMITKKWGFVLMYGSYANSRKNVIDVYTTSGDLIRRVETKLVLTAWTSLYSRIDFDYVVAADKNGKLYLFEAFYANIGESFYDTSSIIRQLIFESEAGVAFAFAENGSVYLAPCQIPSA